MDKSCIINHMQALSTSRPPRRTDIAGQRFGRWQVLRFASVTKFGEAEWLCRCDCGTERDVKGKSLRNGTSTSCGCISKEPRTDEPFEVRNKRYQAQYRTRNRADRAQKLAEWRKANPELTTLAKRRTNYRIKYGLELEEVEAMYEAQGRRCAICRKDIVLGGRSGAKVDHCHKTGKVRGLLCSPCNTGIGCLKDDTQILANAIRYLQGEIGVAG